jgi:hypothetical protein
MKTGGPKGSGWTEDEVPPGSSFRQWSFSGVIRQEFADYTVVTRADGRRTYSGEGGGILEFDGKGGVQLHWNLSAAIANLHGSGNRKNPLTISQGKRKPPKLSPQAKFVTDIRSLFIIPDEHSPEGQSDIPGLPDSPDDPSVIELLETFREECYHLFSLVVRGDATELRRIADWVELSERIRKGEEEFAVIYSNIAKAIRQAAIHAEGIPSRSKVESEYKSIAGEAKVKDLREDLGRMGFSWLHGPTGRPLKKVGKTGG